MELRYSKELYSKQVLLKAAYHFTDKYYLHLDCTAAEYIVEITPKDNLNPDPSLPGIFHNEILAQATRETILLESKEIRELIMGRAFASTIIDEVDTEDSEEYGETDDNLFEDWYVTENQTE